jgi:hypothetical protein
MSNAPALLARGGRGSSGRSDSLPPTRPARWRWQPAHCLPIDADPIFTTVAVDMGAVAIVSTAASITTPTAAATAPALEESGFLVEGSTFTRGGDSLGERADHG